MATHLRVSVITVWIILALSALSISHAAVGDIVTKDFFNIIVYGHVHLSVEGIATKDFFNYAILSGSSDTCAGKNFYTYSYFITAANAFSGFGTVGTSDDQKREIAAFFANVAHNTGSLCYIEEINKSDYCDSTNTQYPCASGKQYYGRGPIQLTWNYNYGAAGDYLSSDLLNSPEIVAHNNLIAWKTALWYWNVNSDCHSAITSGKGFGATIQAINGAIECNGGNTDQVNNRISYYAKYCSELGVDPGSNLSC